MAGGGRKKTVRCYTDANMPLFPFLQVVLSRVIIGIVAILTALGAGSVAEPPAQTAIAPEKPAEISTGAPEVRPIDDAREEETAPKTTIEEEATPPAAPVVAPEESPVAPLAETPREESVEESIATEPVPATTTTPTSFSEVNTNTAQALVNILCAQNNNSAVGSITGSGVMIDPRGVIITNAHVAQFFLLKDYPTEKSLTCTIRTGSPARPMYTAELLYIPPIWISEHAGDIIITDPKGTGENDYAFLRITGRTDPNAELPASFPHLPVDTNADIKTGGEVLVAAYPAGFLGGISIQKDLFAVSSIATIGERFTFDTNTVDLFSTGGTVVSQGGSSGGAAVSQDGTLIGLIVTSTRADTTAERDLRAITLAHINRSLFAYANTSLEALLFGDITLRARLFNIGTAPTLTNILTDALAQ